MEKRRGEAMSVPLTKQDVHHNVKIVVGLGRTKRFDVVELVRLKQAIEGLRKEWCDYFSIQNCEDYGFCESCKKLNKWLLGLWEK